jgi:23S rRNA maturation mini-RNase III
VKFGKNSIVVISALIAVAGGWLAWNSQQAKRPPLARLLTASPGDEWQKRAPAPPRKINDSPVPPRPAPSEARAGDGADRAGANEPAPDPAGGTGADAERPADGPGRDPAESTGAVMKALETYYNGLFHRLNLTSDQAAQLSSLHAAALANAVNALSPEDQDRLATNPAAFSQVIANVELGLDAQVLAQFGDAIYAQYKVEQQTFTQRTTVDRLEKNLSASPTPLTEDQANQLVQILARTEEPGVKSIYSRISAQTLTFAASVLSEPQLQELQQIQREQQGTGN